MCGEPIQSSHSVGSYFEIGPDAVTFGIMTDFSTGLKSIGVEFQPSVGSPVIRFAISKELFLKFSLFLLEEGHGID